VLIAAAVALGARHHEKADASPPTDKPPVIVETPPPPPVTPPIVIYQAPPDQPPPLPPPPQAPAGKKPKVEVVFVLDTTSSMTNLIDGAKHTIWSIANKIASGQPTPDVKIGLVAYRDLHDDYVTKDVALSSDLDATYETLMGFQAEGGGDLPEHVYHGLYDAVYDMQWSPDAMKMIFLVGDAPPHADYHDAYSNYPQIMKDANAKQIAVHAIRCGDDPQTASYFTEIAEAGHGSFSTIAESGGVAIIATPYDEKLGELTRRLDSTMIVVGGAGARGRVEEKMAAAHAAAPSAAADRGGYYAKTGGGLDEDDVVSTGKDVTTVAPVELPPEMQKMSDAEKTKYVAAKTEERQQILKEMAEVSKERDAYIASESKKAETKGPAGFDGVVDHAIESEAKKYDIAY
jgi:hypothetical protein